MLVLKGFSKWPKFVKRMKITLAIAVTHFSMKFGAVTADPPSVCTRGEAFMSAFTSVSATFMASSLFEADQFFCNHSIKFSMLVEKKMYWTKITCKTSKTCLARTYPYDNCMMSDLLWDHIETCLWWWPRIYVVAKRQKCENTWKIPTSKFLTCCRVQILPSNSFFWNKFLKLVSNFFS